MSDEDDSKSSHISISSMFNGMFVIDETRSESLDPIFTRLGRPLTQERGQSKTVVWWRFAFSDTKFTITRRSDEGDKRSSITLDHEPRNVPHPDGRMRLVTAYALDATIVKDTVLPDSKGVFSERWQSLSYSSILQTVTLSLTGGEVISCSRYFERHVSLLHGRQEARDGRTTVNGDDMSSRACTMILTHFLLFLAVVSACALPFIFSFSLIVFAYITEKYPGVWNRASSFAAATAITAVPPPQ
jgi:hypothetical protein